MNAGAEVQTQTGRLSPPGLRFHGVDRADVYYNICVRASRCGKCALNPPTSQPIPPRALPPVPAQRHALPEHARSPTQRRCMPAGCAMHSPPTSQPIPRQRPSPAPAQRHTLPSTSAPPRSPDARPRTATHARRLRDAFLAVLTTHSPPKTFARPAQRHALPEHFRSPTQHRCIPRRPHNPFPSEGLHPSRTATHPPPPFRFGHKKNGTAQCMCDAECLGRPSLRSVIWVGEPRAVRRRCGALACRRGA